MNYGICNEIYHGWELDEVLTHAARTGYRGVEIAPFTLADSVNDISKVERERI